MPPSYPPHGSRLWAAGGRVRLRFNSHHAAHWLNDDHGTLRIDAGRGKTVRRADQKAWFKRTVDEPHHVRAS